ncbi:MAG: FadR/GntR family transcriptional regulator [Gammaproteobacteria bacterium]
MKSGRQASVVRRIAARMRADVLKRKPGEFISSEADMVARYGVSRPTFRQAASLLEQEQLLVMKRGVGGGYFAARPTSAVVAHTASIYLQTKNTSLEEIFAAVVPVRVELARLACLGDSETLREELAAYVGRETRLARKPPAETVDIRRYKEFLKSELDFARTMEHLAGNNVLSLFLDMLYDFCAQLPKTEDLYRDRADRIRAHRALRLKVAQAILDRDPDLAALRMQQMGAAITGWLKESLAGRGRRRRAASIAQIILPPVRAG